VIRRLLWTRRIRLEAPVMTDKERKSALAVPDGTPLWEAVMCVIGEHIDDATNLTRAPQTAAQPSLLSHQAGGLDALMGLREDLAARRQDSLANPVEL